MRKQALFGMNPACRARWLPLWVGIALGWNAARGPAAEPVALRIDSLLVTPAHTPSAVVHVKNLTDSPYQGLVRLDVPAGWMLKSAEQPVSLAPAETAKVAFMVQRGTAVEENLYPLAVSVTGGGATVVRKQNVVTASAPYFKPEIDGDPSDFNDAIPVSWTTSGKNTTIRTYWNRKQFAILVAVEEDRLIPATKSTAGGHFDAIQLAISPQDARTGAAPQEETSRHEFLLVPTGPAAGRCYLLAQPGMKCAETQADRPLEPLAYADAELSVRRVGPTTYYECSLPWKLMRDIRPGEGREFCLSFLVHDPDGTGIRDWGEAAGLWPSQRNRLAWSRWPGARWSDRPPLDNKIPWGMCSSKY